MTPQIAFFTAKHFPENACPRNHSCQQYGPVLFLGHEKLYYVQDWALDLHCVPPIGIVGRVLGIGRGDHGAAGFQSV